MKKIIDKTCYECSEYDLPSRICQLLKEEKNVDDSCKKMTHETYNEDNIHKFGGLTDEEIWRDYQYYKTTSEELEKENKRLMTNITLYIYENKELKEKVKK